METFESVVLGVLKDLRQQQVENDRLEKSFKRLVSRCLEETRKEYNVMVMVRGYLAMRKLRLYTFCNTISVLNEKSN